jgi:hypothetical protein
VELIWEQLILFGTGLRHLILFGMKTIENAIPNKITFQKQLFPNKLELIWELSVFGTQLILFG